MKKTILSLVLLGACSVSWAAPDIKAGEEKASTICVACHGPQGISVNPEWPNLAGQGEKYIIKQLRDFKSGARQNMVMMPQALMLSDADIENVAAYFASQTPPVAKTKGQGEDPEAMLKEGEALYRGGDMANNIPACSACHGPNGAGIDPAMFPHLSAQHATYSRLQLNNFRNAAFADQQASDAPFTAEQIRGNDPNNMMRDIAKNMTPRQIEAVALYIQGLN